MLRVSAVALLVGCLAGSAGAEAVRLRIVERGDNAPLPCRVHWQAPDGSAVKPKGLPSWNDHFVCPGEASFEVPPGEHRLTIERGPEYRPHRSTVAVDSGKETVLEIALERWVEMAKRGWWSGELHVHRVPEEMPLHLRAEDLHYAPVLTVWNRRSLWTERALPESLRVEVGGDRAYDVLACEDERQGGALLFFGLARPLELEGQEAETPSPVVNLESALKQNRPKGAGGTGGGAVRVWVDIEKPFWWDVPTWLATGKIDSIGIANNHMCRSRMYESEAWGRARDAARLAAPRGNGFYSQELYYQILNCGFRVPPSAGSASGVLPNPVGYNRVYVQLDGPFSVDAWWEGLRRGRCFVTNGPMLFAELLLPADRAGAAPRPRARLPGSVLEVEGPTELELRIAVEANDAIEAIEVIRDGAAIERLKPPDAPAPGAGPGAKFSASVKVAVERSTWLLVRAIAAVPETLRFASTAPFYVEVGGRPSTVHRRDVERLMAWIDERIGRIEAGVAQKLGPEALEAVLRPHREAKKFFEALRQRAE
jgi:hypothetical protein